MKRTAVVDGAVAVAVTGGGGGGWTSRGMGWDVVAVHVVMLSVGVAVFEDVVVIADPLLHRYRKVLFGLAYHLITYLFASSRGHRGWVSLHLFCAIASLFQVFPDLFLARVLHTIHFPPYDDFPIRFFQAVSFEFCYLWTIPLFLSLYSALFLREKGYQNMRSFDTFLRCGRDLLSGLWGSIQHRSTPSDRMQ